MITTSSGHIPKLGWMTYGSWARRLVGPDYPWGLQPDELETFLDGMGRAWDTGEWWDHGHPSPNDDERHRRWWARYLRMAASPPWPRT